MNRLATFTRLIQINLILARYGLDKIIFSLHLFRPLRFIIYFNPWTWFRRKELTQGQAIRGALEELGPIFIKFGQALSTRRDLLPQDIADELSRLQDRVPPFPSEVAKSIVEKTFGKPLSELFKTFELQPLASASIAQVHVAQLTSGEEVAVKILRPNIKKQIQRDVQLMYVIAHLAEKYWSEGKRLRTVEVVAEFEKTILDELDLMREAGNASQLRRNFINSHLLYVPKVVWQFTRENILVMERIHGIPVTDLATLKSHHIDRKKLAERGVEIFFTQVLRDSFFHADMHPGNIFVSYHHSENPQYISVDFGIMGTLNERDKHYLAENLHAFFLRDYRRVAQLHIDSGWVPSDTRVDEFESAIRTVCEPVFERPLREISGAQMLLQLFQTGRRFNMPAQPQLVLLQKTLFAIEGLGRELYPDLDLWATAKPFIERWMKERYSPSVIVESFRRNIFPALTQLPELPGLLHDILLVTKQNQILQQRRSPRDVKTHRVPKKIPPYSVAITFFICAVMVAIFDAELQLKPFTLSLLSGSFGILGLLSLFIAYRS